MLGGATAATDNESNTMGHFLLLFERIHLTFSGVQRKAWVYFSV